MSAFLVRSSHERELAREGTAFVVSIVLADVVNVIAWVDVDVELTVGEPMAAGEDWSFGVSSYLTAVNVLLDDCGWEGNVLDGEELPAEDAATEAKTARVLVEVEVELEVDVEEASAVSILLGAGSARPERSTVASDRSESWDVNWMDDDSNADDDLNDDEPTLPGPLSPASVFVTKLGATFSALLTSLFSSLITLTGFRELSFKLSPPASPSQAGVGSSCRSFAMASSCWYESMSSCRDSSSTPASPSTCIEADGTGTLVASVSVGVLAEAVVVVVVEVVAEVVGTGCC